eukprot:c32394_g1_i1.p1 GENE.c32394_g1_i1~~c32394_g1_i1.p1  ORF type:complete len:959 (-),score=296.43 c32394_g1_i1:62-2938(-)
MFSFLRGDSPPADNRPEATKQAENTEMSNLKDQLADTQKLLSAKLDEIRTLERRLIIQSDSDALQSQLSAKDVEIESLKFQLANVKGEGELVFGLSNQLEARESLSQVWKEKAMTAYKSRDELADKTRLLGRELAQAKSQVKSKESEIAILGEKLRMTEDVVLKSRNRRLQELEARMQKDEEAAAERNQALIDLNEQLVNVHREKQQLNEDLEARRQQIETLQKQAFDVETEIKKCNALMGVSGSTDAVASLESIVDVVEKGVQFDVEMDRLRKEIETANLGRGDAEARVEQLREELDVLVEEKGQLTSDLEVTKTQLEEAQASAQTAKNEADAKQQSLEDEVNKLKAGLEASQQMEATHKKMYDAAAADVMRKTQELREMTLKADALESEKNRLTSELKPLQVKQDEYEKTKSGLETTIQQLRDQIDSLSAEVQSKTQQVDFFSEQVKTAEMKVGMTEEEADALVDKIIDLERKLNTRDSMLRALTQELRTTKQELAKKRQQALELDEKMMTTQQRARQNEEQLYIMSEKVEMALLEVKARDERMRLLAGEVEMLRKEVQACDVQLMSAFQRTKALEDKLRTKQTDADHLAAKLADRDMELSRTKAAYTTTNERLDVIKVENKDKSQRLHKALEQIALLDETLSTRNQQLSLMKQKMDFARHEARIKDEEAFMAKRRLEENAIEMQANLNLITPLRERVAEMKELAEQKRALERHTWLLNDKLRVLQEEVRARDDDAQLSKKQATMSEIQVKSLHEKVGVLEHQVSSLSAELELSKAAVARAQGEINKFRASKELMQAMQMREFYQASKPEPVRQIQPTPSQQAVPQAPQHAAVAPVIDSTAQHEAEMAELHALTEKLKDAEAAMHAQAQTMGLMEEELRKAQREIAARESKMEMTIEEYFNSTVLIVKMMLNEKHKPIENILASDLYTEVQSKEIPVEDWPMYVYLRMAATDVGAA